LSPRWNTLYRTTRLEDEQFNYLLQARTIGPEITQAWQETLRVGAPRFSGRSPDRPRQPLADLLEDLRFTYRMLEAFGLDPPPS
jgi:hypothetical protein